MLRHRGRPSIIAVLAAVCLATVLATPAEAAPVERTWTAGGSGSWSTATNWTPVGVPDDGDSVVLPMGSRPQLDVDGIAVGSITLNANRKP